MAWIDSYIEQFIISKYGKRHLLSHFVRKWYCNRYIQVKTPFPDDRIHYEVLGSGVELHFESSDHEREYGDLIDYLIESTASAPEYRWESWNHGEWFRCVYIGDLPDDAFEKHIVDFIAKFDELIIAFSSTNRSVARKEIEPCKELPVMNDNVELSLSSLRYLLSLRLNIPDYQRSYCWEEDNVKCLLDDIYEHCESANGGPYRLGCVILHSHDGVFDIIDGQQRLVTLSLLCDALGVDSHLLDQKFESAESLSYIAYNKFLIRNFCSRIKSNRSTFAEKILDELQFSVLTLQNTSLDLAYTFFSHQNSRGVRLTDYDLLKAHHLRYIPSTFEKQAYRAAEGWNKMIETGHLAKIDNSLQVNPKADHEIVIDTYLYNLRKWMRHLAGGDDGTAHRIKLEFEAAPIIDEIPPFGERFYFNEPIQGGVHFFEWVHRNMQSYKSFSKLPVIKNLREHLFYGSDNHYRSALEALLFCYYLKFGVSYLPEAFIAFLRIIVDHRYRNKRATIGAVLDYVANKNLVQMIDQATSPTFVLAECRNIAKNMSYPRRKDMRPIQASMRGEAATLAQSVFPEILVESFKTLNT